MGRRGRRQSCASTGVLTTAREALENRWARRLVYEPRLGSMVTAKGGQREPYHRWMAYCQGFSPDLVRLFLRQADGLQRRRADPPLLDPFSGSGTLVVECARRGVRALGVEAMPSLVFLTSVAGARDVPPLPDLRGVTTWEQAAERLELAVHRAALIYAVGARHTSAGRLNANAPALLDVLDQTVRMMRDDLRKPLPVTNPVRQGDARKLDGIDAGSIGGILTSPPYLSRHDYTAILKPYETVYAYWYESRSAAQRKLDQIAAHPAALTRRTPADTLPEAAEEVCTSLTARDERKLTALVRAYIADLCEVLAQCSRTLRPGAPCWIVIGGTRLKRVYVPADLILAELASSFGLTVVRVRFARRLNDAGRKLGYLRSVAPRESVLELQKKG